MTTLEQYGLDRRLEALPSMHELNARLAAGGALTSPEFSVLLSYTKIALYRWVLASDLPEDPYLADRLVQYFPQALRERYEAVMPQHRLAREIIATVAVNRFVDSQGITAYHRLSTETGAGVADIMRAQLASRSIFNAGLDEVRIRRLVGLSADVGTELRVVLLRMVERATRWLLNHRHGSLDITATVAEYGAEIAQLRPELLGLLSGRTAASSQAAEQRWLEAGLPEELARNLVHGSGTPTPCSTPWTWPIGWTATCCARRRSTIGWLKRWASNCSVLGSTCCHARCAGMRWRVPRCGTSCSPRTPT